MDSSRRRVLQLLGLSSLALTEYWVPEVDVAGVHELVANALNLPGQNERTTDLRGEDIPGLAGDSEEETDEG